MCQLQQNRYFIQFCTKPTQNRHFLQVHLYYRLTSSLLCGSREIPEFRWKYKIQYSSTVIKHNIRKSLPTKKECLIIVSPRPAKFLNPQYDFPPRVACDFPANQRNSENIFFYISPRIIYFLQFTKSYYFRINRCKQKTLPAKKKV